MTILKRGEPVVNDSGKAIDFKAIFDFAGLEGILKMLQTNEPSLTLNDLEVSQTTQSSIDGVEKMKRLGVYDSPTLRQEYLEIVKLGQEAETLMADFLKENKVHKTYKGQKYNLICDCGFYVGNPEFPNSDKIPKKAKIIS
jgi:hypothetical protein